MGKNNFEEVVKDTEMLLGKPIPEDVIEFTKMIYESVESGKTQYSQWLELMYKSGFKEREENANYELHSERRIQKSVATVN